LQDNDPHAARPLLERVLQIAEPDNPYLHVALDLMGNNIAMIEGDHIQEAEFHRQAIKLAPDAALPRANLVFALLAAGRFSDARREWQTAKHLISKIEEPLPLGQLAQASNDQTLRAYDCLELVHLLDRKLGEQGLARLVERAWKRRAHVPANERLQFLLGLGMQATRCNHDD